jgi:hypothetical protein
MKRYTISIPKELKVKLDKFPDVKWPKVIKEGMISELSKLERLKNRGEL